MKAEAKSLTFMSNEGSVKIPFFQRTYVWNEDNWEELISDLLDSNKSHFLGSLILKQESVGTGSPKQVLVIDGQQRLTTLSILLRALCDSFDVDTQKGCQQTLEYFLYYKKTASSNDLFVRIDHSKVDRLNYQAVIKKEIDPLHIDMRECKSNILKCYRFFTDKFSQINFEKRRKLFDDLLNQYNHILVVIDLTDADDEQSIFDTINSAGVRLSSADIIKNVLFQKAFELYNNNEEVEALYENFWEAVFAKDEQTIAFWAKERTLGRLKRDNLEILLHSIAVIEGFFDPEKNNLTDLTKIYKDHISVLHRDELRQFVGTISDYAKLYREKILVVDKRCDNFSYREYEKRFFHILNECEVSTFHPYILYLYKNYGTDEETLRTALHKLETLVIRRFVCNSTTKNYNKLCKDLIYDPSKLDDILSETSDNVFMTALQHINNKQATLLLFWVELYRRYKDNCCEVDELKYTYTLEHIMPQKWEEYWSDIPVIDENSAVVTDADSAKQLRYRMIYSIGNMTLLKGALNSALHNYEFERKVKGEGRKHGIEYYAELGITKHDIVIPFNRNDKIWNETKIRIRTEEIAKDVLAIWGITSE